MAGRYGIRRGSRAVRSSGPAAPPDRPPSGRPRPCRWRDLRSYFAPKTNTGLAARRQTSHGIRGALHPCWIASLLRCFLGEWLRHAPREAPCQPGASPLSVLARAHPRTASSRLASGALRHSRCSREIIHGPLAGHNRMPGGGATGRPVARAGPPGSRPRSPAPAGGTWPPQSSGHSQSPCRSCRSSSSTDCAAD